MDANTEKPALLIPSLRSFYDAIEPLSWVLIRCAVGLPLAVHGWMKITLGTDVIVPMLGSQGYEQASLLYYFLIFVELVGGLAIALGLFTRFFAAMATIEMFWLMFAHYLSNGFSWTQHGYEFVMLWGLVAMAVWWRGGGPYSLDRVIGREL
jgi:putative oxidoreductase